MTSPGGGEWAKARVGVDLDWGNLDSELRTRLTRSVEVASKASQRHLKDLADYAARQFDSMGNAYARQMDRMVGDTKTATTTVNKQLRSLSKDLSIRLTVDTAGAQILVREAHARLQAWLDIHPLTVGVHIDSGESQIKAVALHRLLSSEMSPITQKVRIDNSGGGGLASMTRGLDGIGRSAATLAKVTAGIVAIAGAAGIAAGAVGGLMVGLSGLAAAGLPAIGALTVGLSGIKDAFSAFGKESTGGAVDDSSTQIASATERVTTSQHSLTSAIDDEKQAQLDIITARKDAKDSIDDLNLSLRGSKIDEKEAALAVRKAREALAKAQSSPTATPDDREEAQLNVDEAVQRQLEAQKRTQDIAAKTADANAKGIEGSDQVVAAKKRESDAQYQVAAAQREVAAAQRDMTKAQQQNAAAGGADKVAEALAKLSPNAKAFVLAVHSMGDAWHELKTSTQDALFTNADTEFTHLATAVMPVLKSGLTGIATSMNGVAVGLSQMLSSSQNVGILNEVLKGAAQFVDQMKPGLLPMVQGFIDLGGAMAPVLGQLGGGLGAMLGQIGSAFTQLGPQLGELGRNFSTLLSSGVGPLLHDLIASLVTMGNQVLPFLTPLLKTLGDSFTNLAPSIGNAGGVLAKTLTDILPSVTRLVEALVNNALPAFGDLAKMIPPVADVLTHILNALGPQTVSNIIEVVGAIALMTKAMAVINIVLNANPIGIIVVALTGLAAALIYAYNHSETFRKIVQGTWEGIQKTVSAVWNDVWKPILGWIGTGLKDVGDAATWLWNKAIVPAWDGIKTAVSDAKKFLEPIIEDIKGFWNGLSTTVSDVWDTIVTKVKDAVRGIAILLQKYGNSSWPLPLKSEAKSLGNSLIAWAGAKADGGPISGKGTGTSDSNIIAASHGEYMVRAASVRKPGNRQLLDALNYGGLSIYDLIPAFADGGLVGKVKELQGTPYAMGGFSTSGIDCSGLVAWMVNTALGEDGFGGGRMSTANEGVWLSGKGAVLGEGGPGTLRIGWYDNGGGGANGHTAGTLPDGTNFESNGTDGVIIGGPVGADDPMFTDHAYFPAAALAGGDAGGPATFGSAGTGTGTGGGGSPFASGGAGVGAASYGNAGGASGFGNAAAARAGGLTVVWVDNWPAALFSRSFPDSTATPDAITPPSQKAALPADAPQKDKTVAAVIAEGKQLGRSDAEIKAAVETVLVESEGEIYANAADPESLNIAHTKVGSDGSSTGPFQQQNNGEWGTVQQRMDPTESARMFFEGIDRLGVDKSGTPGQIAQAVQRSAFPDRYDQRSADADELIERLSAIAPANQIALPPTHPVTDSAGTSRPVGDYQSPYLDSGKGSAGDPDGAPPSSTPPPPPPTLQQQWLDTWAPKANDWANETLKSIGGEFLDPIGLKDSFDAGFDALVNYLKSPQSEKDRDAVFKFAETVIINGADPAKVREEVTKGMTAVLSTYRGG